MAWASSNFFTFTPRFSRRLISVSVSLFKQQLDSLLKPSTLPSALRSALTGNA
jgi:hypothetical protein